MDVASESVCGLEIGR